MRSRAAEREGATSGHSWALRLFPILVRPLPALSSFTHAVGKVGTWDKPVVPMLEVERQLFSEADAQRCSRGVALRLKLVDCCRPVMERRRLQLGFSMPFIA